MDPSFTPKKNTEGTAVMKTRALLFLCGIILTLSVVPSPALAREHYKSIVPPSETISDFETRRALAEILSWRDETIGQALEEYSLLLKEKPDSARISYEVARIHFRLGNYEKAEAAFERVLGENPDDREALRHLARIRMYGGDLEGAGRLQERLLSIDPEGWETLAEAGDIAAALGHGKQSRDFFIRALELAPEEARDGILIRFSGVMYRYGDFYGIERILRHRLRGEPESREIQQKLIRVLSDMDRFEEAEELCLLLLLETPDHHELHLELARLKIRQHDYRAALAAVSAFRTLEPEHAGGIFLAAKVLFLTGRLDEALPLYRTLEDIHGYRAQALLEMGKIFLARGEPEQAQVLLEEALREDETRAEAGFLMAGEETVLSEEFRRNLIRRGGSDFENLHEWADLYRRYGKVSESLELLEAILAGNPHYLPAQMTLAETLAIAGFYDESILHYESLAEDFPESVKILTGYARVLSWARRYEPSMDIYEIIHAMNPENPVPLREKARVAYWGKYFTRSMSLYDQLLSPPLDALFFLSVKARYEEDPPLNIQNPLSAAEEHAHIFEGYETFIGSVPEFSIPVKREILHHHSRYAIQKEAYLEKTAKKHKWERRFVNSLERYEELVRFRPGNQEALFDLAMAYCTVGLVDCEKVTLEKLQAISPLHSLARYALERNEIRNRPLLSAGLDYWNEEGRGELSRVERLRTDVTVEVPIVYRHHLRLSGITSTERTGGEEGSLRSRGLSADLRGVFTSRISGAAGLASREYADGTIPSSTAGYGRLEFKPVDPLLFRIGFERADKKDNRFGLRKGIQTDTWFLSADYPVTRNFDVGGALRALDYSDGNKGVHHSIYAGVALSDHPKAARVIVSGEYRHTDAQNQFVYTGGVLTDILHPYWTPHDYWGTAVTFHWNHDLSDFFFCGAERHFYEVLITFGTDRVSNQSLKLEAGWRHDFRKRWTIELRGMLYRSGEWDAEHLTARVGRRF